MEGSRFVRSAIHVGGTVLSPWRVAVQVGLAAGTLTLLAVTALTGGSLALALALVPPALVGFVVWGHARRALSGRETTVLLEHLLLAEAVWAAALCAARLPVLPWLDRLNAGLCVVLGFGRVGCLLTGCCFGLPASFGVRYPAECHPDHPEVTRLPVQGAEALVWFTLAAVAIAVAVHRPPGAATGFVFMGYGLARVLLEALRDDRRPQWRGVSESTALGAGLFVLGAAVDPTRPSGHGAFALQAFGALLVGGLLAGRSRWLAPHSLERFAAAAFHDHGRRLAESGADEELRAAEVGGLRVVTSALGAVRLVTLAGAPAGLLRLAGEELCAGYGAQPLGMPAVRGALWVIQLPTACDPARGEKEAVPAPEPEPEPVAGGGVRPESYFTGGSS